MHKRNVCFFCRRLVLSSNNLFSTLIEIVKFSFEFLLELVNTFVEFSFNLNQQTPIEFKLQ